jgi:hypothetical protein
MSTLYPSYYHSFAITDSKLVFMEMPLKMNLFKMFTTAYFSGRSYANAMEWNNDLKVCARVRTHGPRVQTRVHLRDMRTGARVNDIVYTADAMFSFHHGNSYEQDGCIVLDLVAYVSTALMKCINIVCMQLQRCTVCDVTIYRAATRTFRKCCGKYGVLSADDTATQHTEGYQIRRQLTQGQIPHKRRLSCCLSSRRIGASHS